VKIQIEYPYAMKMLCIETFEVSDTVSLKELKELILGRHRDFFLKVFQASTGVPISLDHVILKDNEVVIGSDEELKERLKRTSSFKAVFSQ
jgi:hypothetical protein